MALVKIYPAIIIFRVCAKNGDYALNTKLFYTFILLLSKKNEKHETVAGNITQ